MSHSTGDILRRNGRVWIVERNRRVAQLDAAQYGMLLARYTDTNGQSTPPAEFFVLTWSFLSSSADGSSGILCSLEPSSTG